MADRSKSMEKEILRRVRVEMNRCIHFTGIADDKCQAGVNYRTMIGGPDYGWAKHLPCLRDDGSPVSCPLATFPSEDEARAKVDQREAAITEFLNQLNEGICPHCKVAVKQRQVGPCVYGTCGHRLYQGKVNPEYAAL